MFYRNGHMLTHRHKKPFECKANGCGKSYCDARSLRRHTENHHHHQPSSNQGSPPASPSSSTGSGCIQYAPAPMPSPPGTAAAATSTTATVATAAGGSSSASGASQQTHDATTPSQLQKLLSAEPLSSNVTAHPAKVSVNKTNYRVETVYVPVKVVGFNVFFFCRIQEIFFFVSHLNRIRPLHLPLLSSTFISINRPYTVLLIT